MNIPKLELSSGCTVLLGGNGQGKTNILEAIYLLSYGRSFRGLGDQVINWREEEARVFGQGSTDSIEIIIRRDKDNKILVNGKPKKVSSLLGRFPSVVFHPQEIEIVFGPPLLRRSWLDRTIATVDKKYLYALINYQRALKNKNRLLKTGRPTTEMEAWNKSLATYGTKIWQIRESAISVFNQLLKSQTSKLTGKQIFLKYKNPLVGEKDAVAENLYFKALLSQQEIERRFMVTLFGPHRDDFKIIAEEEDGQTILQKNLAEFGSRAEQRQAAFLLKLTELKFFAKTFGAAPVLLLDDIASELDSKNRELLLGHLSAPQVIITATNLDSLPEAIRRKSQVLNVQNGVVTAG